uniref:FHA domain-containing protein n=1 Tax=Strombidinopsis acuminata TaxID=141414 RepID=A0A7S3WK80_9SPIT|mmetsp:Transcript_42023/g.57134  ORF Transcript_42023/g.57134 Transcript_42023/m.57134 type:complete len:113 (+) Transcript_42023:1-339(+)
MSSKAWGTLICIGAKDGDQRKIDLCKAEAAIGRKPGCLVLYQDTTISSTHCKLSLTVASTAGAAARPATGQLVMQVWLEDCSVNGTYVNAQKIGRGNKVRLADGDKIGLLKA